MPGIVGLISDQSPEVAERELATMVDKLCHEPFYTKGTWSDASLGVYIGWVARKNSFADGMPLRNEQRDIVLVFAGEEYPDPGIRQQLKQRGHALTADKGSHLVHLYEEDPHFPASLNGTFHGAVVHQSAGTVTLFNDRFGMQRLYYHQAKRGFYFAAEIKALLAVCPELRSADERGLAEFIGCGCVMHNRTLFKGVEIMPPGSVWSFRGASPEWKRTYFKPSEWENQPPLEAEAYYRSIRDAIATSLPRYFNGNDKIGMALTGGLDTRVIMAWHRAPAGMLPCYTFGSMYRDNQDVRIARQVSYKCGQDHTVIPVGTDFLSRFSNYAERSIYLTDGCVDLSRSADLYVSEKARTIAPTKVVGTYGSEVLKHATMFKPFSPLADLLGDGVGQQIDQALVSYAELKNEHPVTFAAFRQSPWWHVGVVALEQTQLTVRSPFLDNAFIQAAYRAPRGAAPETDVRLRLIAEGNPQLGQMQTDLGASGMPSSLAGTVRRQVRQFTFRADHAYDYSMPQWLAKVDHLLSPFHLERLFLGRHKMSHYRVWYRDALSGYVQEMLLDSRTLSRPYLRRKGVEAIVYGHLKGNRNYTKEIHKVLTLELIHRRFLDRG